MAIALLCVGIVSGGFSRSALAQEEREPEKLVAPPRWVGSLEQALTTARERNCAVMVALNLDGERGNQDMVDRVYRLEAFEAGAKQCVVAIASLGAHSTSRDPVSGRTVCSRFGSVTCAEHQALEKIIREDWLKRGPKDDVESPRHFFLSPAGRILFQRTWTAGAEELGALMKRATELCTPEALEKWDSLEGRLTRAADPLPYLRQLALADLLGENDDAIDERLAALARKTDSIAVRMDIVRLFAAAESEARRDHAYGFLADKDEKVRIRTAYLFEGRGDAAALPALLARAAKEKEPAARGALYRAIGNCGAGQAKVRDALLKWARKKKDASAPHAIVALAPWAGDDPVYKALVKIPWGKHSVDARKAACWTLGLSGHKDLGEKIALLGEEDRALEYVAGMASKMLAGETDEKRYRGAAGWIIQHPISTTYDR